MYKLTKSENTILRAADGARIPTDPANRDYAEYLRWRAEGGIPTPVHEPSADELAALADAQAAQEAKAEARSDNVTQYITRHTPDEIKTWVQGKLPSLPPAEAAFISRLAVAIGALYRGG